MTSGTDTIIVQLPASPPGAARAAHWWRLERGAVTASGADDQWLDAARVAGRLIGLAPAEAVRIDFSNAEEGTSERQAATLAALAARERGLAEPDTLHSASALLPSRPGRLVTATLANHRMVEWLDWAEQCGVALDSIVPTAMVLPFGEETVRALVGNDPVIGRDGLVAVDDPMLSPLLFGDEEVTVMDPAQVDAALAALAADPVPNLRSGRFARRRLVLRRDRIVQLALTAAAIALVTLASVLVQIVKLDRSRADLDARTARLERSLPLAARTPETAGATLAALLLRTRSDPSLSVTSIAYRDGQLDAGLRGGSEAVNAPLAALQRDGFHVALVTPPGGQETRISVRARP